MVLLEILCEVPRLHHFLTKDWCADKANTYTKDNLQRNWDTFQRIATIIFFNLSFPSSNHYLKKRIIPFISSFTNFAFVQKLPSFTKLSLVCETQSMMHKTFIRKHYSAGTYDFDVFSFVLDEGGGVTERP